MTHVVPERVVGVPAVETVPVSNVKFEIKGTAVTFHETAEPFNNRDVFETFDLARAAAVQVFAKHKADVFAALSQTEKELLTVTGPTRVAVAPTSPAVVNEAVAPVSVVANSPAVTATPLV